MYFTKVGEPPINAEREGEHLGGRILKFVPCREWPSRVSFNRHISWLSFIIATFILYCVPFLVFGYLTLTNRAFSGTKTIDFFCELLLAGQRYISFFPVYFVTNV